ncbi:Hypothetical predicted protein [Scomber scombrus]|uniref:Uncharacterized protein n=1 Tax=Scomber scombrus TaxID=13677 RepID=A0AAV1P451_SCOSC
MKNGSGRSSSTASVSVTREMTSIDILDILKEQSSDDVKVLKLHLSRKIFPSFKPISVSELERMHMIDKHKHKSGYVDQSGTVLSLLMNRIQRMDLVSEIESRFNFKNTTHTSEVRSPLTVGSPPMVRSPLTVGSPLMVRSPPKAYSHSSMGSNYDELQFYDTAVEAVYNTGPGYLKALSENRAAVLQKMLGFFDNLVSEQLRRYVWTLTFCKQLKQSKAEKNQRWL